VADCDFSRLSALVVDDQISFRRVLADVLRALGFGRVLMAGSGSEALELLAQGSIDIALVDYRMETMSGLDIARRIRRGDRGVNPYVPVIMVSDDTTCEAIFAARDAGVNEFLAKPLSAERVLMRVRSVLDNPRPFVRSGTFVGPDRRRRKVEISGVERRTRGHDYNARSGQREQRVN
jgi:CheY-like chemotaxis protein